MAVTPTSFRGDFPEFADTGAYPDTTVQFYLNLAVVQVGPTIWGNYADYGTELFIAHYLVLEREATKAAARGGLPGIRTGAIASEGAGGVTVSLDTANAALKDGHHWNRSQYGIRFASMRGQMGIGGLQT